MALWGRLQRDRCSQELPIHSCCFLFGGELKWEKRARCRERESLPLSVVQDVVKNSAIKILKTTTESQEIDLGNQGHCECTSTLLPSLETSNNLQCTKSLISKPVCSKYHRKLSRSYRFVLILIYSVSDI